MYDEFVEHINGLIYYGFFYKQDGSYIDDIMESLKEKIEIEINKKLDWEELKYQKLEADICEPVYDSYYTEKEFNKILKSIKINSVENIKIDIDIEDYKKRVINFFMSDGVYTDYIILKEYSN